MISRLREAVLSKYSIIQYTMMTLILYISFIRATTIIKPNVIFTGDVKVDIHLLVWATTMVAVLYLFVALMRFLKIGFVISKDEGLVLLFSVTLFVYALIYGSHKSMDYIQPIGFFAMYFMVSTALKTLKWDEKSIVNVLLMFFSISMIYLLSSLYTIVSDYSRIAALPRQQQAWNIIGISYNPNDFANQMLLGIMAIGSLSIYYIYHQEHKVKALLLFLFIPIETIFIFLGNSRGALFGLVIYLFILMIYVIINKIITWDDIKKHRKTVIILFSISSMFLLFLIASGIFTGFFSKFDHGTSHRYEMWAAFFRDNLDHFPRLKLFVGETYTGFHNTLATYVRYENPVTVPHLHNFFLEGVGRYGLINMLIISYVIVDGIRKGFKSKALWFLSIIPFGFMAREMFEANLLISTFRWEMIFFWFAIIAPNYYDKYSINRKIKNEK